MDGKKHGHRLTSGIEKKGKREEKERKDEKTTLAFSVSLIHTPNAEGGIKIKRKREKKETPKNGPNYMCMFKRRREKVTKKKKQKEKKKKKNKGDFFHNLFGKQNHNFSPPSPPPPLL